MSFLLGITVVIGSALISLALVVGISLGLGWTLAHFFPLSLFEGTVVSMAAGLIAWSIWRPILNLPTAPGFSKEVEEEEDIPESRFWKSGRERTWENWFRYMFANSIYGGLVDSWDEAEEMSEETLQEQAIRLADAVVKGLKDKSAYTKRLRISPETLKHELSRMGQRLHDNEMLETAAEAANEELGDWEDEALEVIRRHLWGKPAKVD